MTDTYYTTHSKRHWWEWPIVVVASIVMWIALVLIWIALVLFVAAQDICDRVIAE